MASIDWSTLAVGALIGIGCRKQLRAASRVAAVTAANLAGVAATAAAQVARETQETSQSSEEQAAERKLAEIDQKMAEQLQGQPQAGKKGH